MGPTSQDFEFNPFQLFAPPCDIFLSIRGFRDFTVNCLADGDFNVFGG